jgi:hypothetical protein
MRQLFPKLRLCANLKASRSRTTLSASRLLASCVSEAHLFAGGLVATFGQTGLLLLIAIMLGRRRLRCAYGVRRREALFQTFLKLVVRCFIRFRRFFRVRRVLIRWRWIEFVAHRSLPSIDQSSARPAVPLPGRFTGKRLQREPIRSMNASEGVRCARHRQAQASPSWLAENRSRNLC